jgi:metallo-beta-lactamase family protein
MLNVTFCGAARTVTGSQYYLEYADPNGGIFRFCVDSGMFQVGRKLNLFKVNSHLLFDPKKLDCIILTHAHLDHCGRIPYLVKKGFGGRIYSTNATKQITQVVLEDAAKQHQDGLVVADMGDILGDNNSSYVQSLSDEAQAELGILYDQQDVNSTLTRFRTYEYHQKFQIHPNLEIEFWDAGHILGSAFVIITEISSGKTLAFSGDLGNINKPIIEDPEMPCCFPQLTHIFVETTYGNRLHGKLDPKEKLRKVVAKGLKERGKILIPSFSVERAQEIIYFLVELMRENKIMQVPIYLDSPMASKVLKIMLDSEYLYDDHMKKRISEKAHPLIYKYLSVLETSEDSKSLNKRNKPCIIIAGSGMLNGGRILKHLLFNIDNPKHTLIFVGYQATSTLGRQIIDGAREVEIEGKWLEVKNKIEIINEFSAHADQRTLKDWIVSLVHGGEFGSRKTKLKPTVFLMHGEKEASLGFGEEIDATFVNEVKTYWPHFGEKVTLWEQ